MNLSLHKPKLFWFAALLLALLPAWGQVRYPVTVSGYQVRPSLFLDDYTLAGMRSIPATKRWQGLNRKWPNLSINRGSNLNSIALK
jgi:hypothetical protein